MRIAYGPGEQEAHETLRSLGTRYGFPVEQDFAGNTYVRLKGRANAKSVVIGSHLDAVPQGVISMVPWALPLGSPRAWASPQVAAN